MAKSAAGSVVTKWSSLVGNVRARDGFMRGVGNAFSLLSPSREKLTVKKVLQTAHEPSTPTKQTKQVPGKPRTPTVGLIRFTKPGDCRTPRLVKRKVN